MTKRSPSKVFPYYVVFNEQEQEFVDNGLLCSTVDEAKDLAEEADSDEGFTIYGITPVATGQFTGLKWKEV